MEHKLVKFLTKDQNILKLVEECAELQEVMIKSITKSEAFKPKKDKMIEEMGDVLFRMHIVCQALDIPCQQVLDRMNSKSAIMDTWVKNKQSEKG